MENFKEPTREEMQEMIEKAQRDWQNTLDAMTPEERAEALRKAQEALAKDEAERQRLLDTAAELLGKKETAEKPKFCPNCGAPANGGNFCEYCGAKL